MEALEISSFLGQGHVDARQAWIVYETEYETHRDVLGRLYAKYRDYIPGGFSIKWYGQECFGPRYWDDVLFLAEHFEQSLTRLAVDEESDFLMPDQPVPVRLDLINDDREMRFIVSGKTLLVCSPEAFGAKMTAAIQRLRNFVGTLWRSNITLLEI